jgi:small subunit ribosomal protein S17
MAENKHKTMTGRVISAQMNKTCIVGVEKQKEHPLYRKTYRVTVKYKVHDEKGECRPDDKVRIVETRPLSKEKRWRIAEILSKATAVEVKPEEVV